MNTSKADQLIITSLGVTSVLAIAQRVTTGGVPNVVRVLIGAFIAAAMLTLAAQGVPDLAGMLAVLILVAFVAHAGPDLWAALTHATRATGGNATGALAHPSTSKGTVLA